MQIWLRDDFRARFVWPSPRVDFSSSSSLFSHGLPLLLLSLAACVYNAQSRVPVPGLSYSYLLSQPTIVFYLFYTYSRSSQVETTYNTVATVYNFRKQIEAHCRQVGIWPTYKPSGGGNRTFLWFGEPSSVPCTAIFSLRY